MISLEYFQPKSSAIVEARHEVDVSKCKTLQIEISISVIYIGRHGAITLPGLINDNTCHRVGMPLMPSV
ncbi:hypothetical protein BgiMline_030297 [Biomphalaria glabrata]